MSLKITRSHEIALGVAPVISNKKIQWG